MVVGVDGLPAPGGTVHATPVPSSSVGRSPVRVGPLTHRPDVTVLCRGTGASVRVRVSDNYVTEGGREWDRTLEDPLFPTRTKRQRTYRLGSDRASPVGHPPFLHPCTDGATLGGPTVGTTLPTPVLPPETRHWWSGPGGDVPVPRLGDVRLGSPRRSRRRVGRLGCPRTLLPPVGVGVVPSLRPVVSRGVYRLGGRGRRNCGVVLGTVSSGTDPSDGSAWGSMRTEG